MKTSDYDYPLPDEKIAYRPLDERQNSKLMVLTREDRGIEHRRFYELPELLRRGDLLIFNNTKVIPARLYGKKKSGSRIEILLLEKLDERIWKCLARGPKDNMEVEFERGLTAKLINAGDGQWQIIFSENIEGYLDRIGNMPLPPYIKREPDESDKATYQTVYADKEGAVAAPTAGLHFTRGLIEDIEQRGIETGYVTLHVGVGTFMPVKTENISAHIMHSEYIEVPERTCGVINKAKEEGRRVIAVGTTVVRTLESSVDGAGKVMPASGTTELFITPGFEFKAVDAVITNFHLPRSTLLMLVSAFAGRDFILSAYRQAIEKDYRFLSYGDAMFIC
jgi:S-adenosylmethionine:tRNA ribosyltransferase-isomerase